MSGCGDENRNKEQLVHHSCGVGFCTDFISRFVRPVAKSHKQKARCGENRPGNVLASAKRIIFYASDTAFAIRFLKKL